MLENITFPQLPFGNDCQRTAAALVNSLDHSSTRGQVILDVWALLNGTVGDMSDYTFRQVDEWYGRFDYNSDLSSSEVQSSMVEACRSQVCSKLNVPGNPDLGGIGVFIAYCIEIGLAAFFIIAFSLFALLQKRYLTRLNTRIISTAPVFAALQSSLGVFFDVALLFAFSVSIASILLTRTDRTFYTAAFLFPGLIIVICVPLALWPFYASGGFHVGYRRVLLDVLILLPTFWSVLGNGVTSGSDWILMSKCNPSGSMHHAVPYFGAIALFLSLGYVLLRILGFIFSLARHSWASIPLRARIRVALRLFHTAPMNPATMFLPQRIRACQIIATLLDALAILISCVMFGSSLSEIAQMRQFIDDAVPGGLQQNQWGFGQVISVAAWLPTVVDFYYISSEHLEGFKRRLPAGLQVYDEQLDSVEETGVLAQAGGYRPHDSSMHSSEKDSELIGDGGLSQVDVRKTESRFRLSNFTKDAVKE